MAFVVIIPLEGNDLIRLLHWKMLGRTKAAVISWLVGLICGCWNLRPTKACLSVFSHLWKEKWNCGSVGNTPPSSDGSAGRHPVEAERQVLVWEHLQQAFAFGMCFRTGKSRNM